MLEVREIDEGELERLLALRNAIRMDDPVTVADYVDWRRQAEDMTWLLAGDDGRDLGAGIGIHGWHSPPGVGRIALYVSTQGRGRGVGSALLARVSRWL